ncbi:tRNA 2-thiouridine(34) synthase MnmA [Desulfosediminicola flagellatus]|uniref:tRNA 2-thiouridine(34) synthase MnmA n=1 Tax=Desulfosediminicola flagellatus TaxID=2569541 RepID=UPI00142EE963|nr:tRNA 2-thiouridine(34) synthase MnmA [Desulfosediminicola flagellatus]
MNSRRIGIAMSGGVDSTATALILRESNDIQGFFMRLAQPDFAAQKERVEKLAERLSIPLTIIDLRQQFTDKVLEYFASSYFKGKTPNPCMICNREIKFGLFQDAILSSGMEMMASGHYAQISHDESGYHLLDGVDQSKNQSYFLSRLTQKQLGKILFPLGAQYKSDIYDYVKQNGFTHFEGIESQDICFLADETVGNYLESRYPESVKKGPIVSTEGKLLGEHNGLFRHTIGQRRGLGIPDSTPWYVTGIEADTNTLIVGKTASLMKHEIELGDIHWLSGIEPPLEASYKVRIRYSHRGSMAKVELIGKDRAHLIFEQEQRAVTPGQYAVIYKDTEVIGSGIILS